MADYIDRQAAIDALGERPLNWDDNEFDLGLVAQFDADRRMIEAVPSVDAVEVVRCKDCKWYELFYTLNGNEFRCCCRESKDSLRNSDDYCSYGELK